MTKKSRTMNTSPTRGGKEKQHDEDEGVQCPLCAQLGYERGKATVFRMGIVGWDKHIASHKRHPEWNPKVRDPEERKRLFKKEFPEFMELGLTVRNAEVRAEYRHNERQKRRRQARQGHSTPGVIMPMSMVTRAPMPHLQPGTTIVCPQCLGRGRVTVSYSPLPDDNVTEKGA